jgi:hypothetical protein
MLGVTHLGGCVDFLRPFIWGSVFGLMRFAMDPTASVHQSLCKFCKSETETVPMIREAFGEESMSQGDKATIFPLEESKLTVTEKGETGEEQSQE